MTNYEMSYIANYGAVSKPERKWRYLQMRACTARRQETEGLPLGNESTDFWKPGATPETVHSSLEKLGLHCCKELHFFFSFRELSALFIYSFSITKMYKKEERQSKHFLNASGPE